MVALTLLTLPLSQLENLTRWKPTSTVLSMAIGGHGYGGHGHGGHGHSAHGHGGHGYGGYGYGGRGHLYLRHTLHFRLGYPKACNLSYSWI